jgi:hypothetical protein
MKNACRPVPLSRRCRCVAVRYVRGVRNYFYLYSSKHLPYHKVFKIKGMDDNQIHIVTCMSDSRRGFGLEIGFIDHLQVVTTNN